MYTRRDHTFLVVAEVFVLDNLSAEWYEYLLYLLILVIRDLYSHDLDVYATSGTGESTQI